jgi:hypothetical protein
LTVRRLGLAVFTLRGRFLGGVIVSILSSRGPEVRMPSGSRLLRSATERDRESSAGLQQAHSAGRSPR